MQKNNEVRIGSHLVGEGHPVFVVAEIGINHNGSIELAKRLIDAAVKAGCDAVKFQKRTIGLCYTPEELAQVRPNDPERPNPWGIDLLTNEVQKRKLEFGEREYEEIDRYCREKGIIWFASPWDEPSVDFLERFDPPCYKIPSARVRGEESFLRYVRSKGRPLILSTGACTFGDVALALEVIGRENLILTHCVLQYPCESENLNLLVIPELRKRVGVPVGYSGHEKGVATSVMAAVLGAVMIERHISLDRAMYGSDQAASLEPGGLTLLVRDIRTWERARGDGLRAVLPGEEVNYQKLRRKV